MVNDLESRANTKPTTSSELFQSFYQRGIAEAWGDTLITFASIFRDISLYMSPFIMMYMYRRGMNNEEVHQFCNMFGGLGCILAIAFLLRAWGRACSPEYMLFIKTLNRPKHDMSRYLEEIRKFDFEFYAWPATYVVPYNPNNALWDQNKLFVSKENQHLQLYQKFIVKILAYVAVKTFALRLIYPGSLSFIHYLLKTSLLEGRARLVEEHKGIRVKIVAADGNSIDTMLVDNRVDNKRYIGRRASLKGSTLVICSEGNSGFYEVGIMMTPLKAGYSVLGWNHPGFAGSTGLPYPRQELAAIDAVLDYAIKQLKFQREQIVMFGWSIGGYSAAWAACVYNTRALVLDATFDDLLALAVKQMPASWEPLVREVVRGHVNLNVADVLRSYRGPVHLIRRTEDEIICLTAGDINTNRGNNLLVKLIEYRHSDEDLFDEELLVRYANMADVHRPNCSYELDEKSKYILSLNINVSYLNEGLLTGECGSRRARSASLRGMKHWCSSNTNKITMYSSDLRSTHCVPLPTLKFLAVVTELLSKEVLISRSMN